MDAESKAGTHGGRWRNGLQLGRDTLRNSDVVVDTTVMMFMWGHKVLCNVIGENKGRYPKDGCYSLLTAGGGGW